MKIKEGEKLRVGYGWAWDNWESLTSTIYPVPFNILLRKLRNLWFKLVRQEQTQCQEAFSAGLERGKKATDYVMKQEIKRLEEEIKEWENFGDKIKKIWGQP